jgi:superfamily II DNA or RNA helicase
LLSAVRSAALPGIWSQGVKLAREKAVTPVSSTRGATTLRVRAAGHAIAPTVTLYFEDLEWTCDCGARVDPCAHVAAAAILSVSASESTDELAAASARKGARLCYRLEKKDRRLSLTRFVVRPDGREEPFQGSLASDLARGRLGAGLVPTHDDLLIDRMVTAHQGKAISTERLPELFAALSGSSEVTLEGTKVRVSGERVLPRAVIEDDARGGYLLRIERDPEVSEVVAMGVARLGDLIRPLGEVQTTGYLLERLPLARSFSAAQETELVTLVLPELEQRLPVHIATRKLSQKNSQARPRIAMDLSHHGHTLSVLPLLVYGDPAIARIDADAVVALGNAVPVRRLDQERKLIQRLRDELNLVPGRRVDFDGSDAIRFAHELQQWERRLGERSRSRLFDQLVLRPRVELDGARFDVVFEGAPAGNGSTQGMRADAGAVISAWREGLELVPLQGGGWAQLPAAWLSEHGHRVADLLAARDQNQKLPTAMLPELGALCDALDLPKPLGLEKLTPLLQGFDRIPQFPLPPGLTADLRNYQKLGVDWLGFLRNAELGAVLADDMGLGKTLQTLCVLGGRALIVCPKSVVYNWADETVRFRPALKTSIYHGAQRELDPKADLTLTTYALLRMDAELFARESWNAVVLDEAQAIKNPHSQTARAAFRLSGRFRLALTGTPVENRLEELWSIMHFANPGLLGGLSDFHQRYAEPIAAGDGGAASRLRARVRPFVLRRMKREVLPELPPRSETVLHVELEPAERIVYDAVRAATKKQVSELVAHGGGVLQALEALLRLRQAACHPSLVPGQHAEGSSKIERLLEALEEAASDGHKALVFSQWTSLLDLVEPHLDAAKISFTRLDGSTQDRAAVVGAFQADAGPPVLLISLKAGGIGLNLTAADHVFLLDPWWNPAVEDQAADRAHRIGQDRPVMVYRMVSKDTVEERILALQEKKRALFEAALGDADHAGGITRDDLLALLE